MKQPLCHAETFRSDEVKASKPRFLQNDKQGVYLN